MPLRVAIGLLSGAAIAYQLLLMRLFSITQWHHFAYMVISLALLGYGASGALLTLFRQPLLKRFDFAFFWLAVLFGLSTVLCFAGAQRLRLNPFEVMWDPRQLGILTAVYLLLAVPFVCAGGAVGLALARFGDSIHRIYRADLVGAAGGSGALIGSLYLFRPADCLRLVAFVAGLAAVVSLFDRAGRGDAVGRRLGARRAMTAFGCAAAIALPFLWPPSWLTPRMSEYKALAKTLEVPGTEILAERSSPLGSLAAVQSGRIPFRIAPGLSFNFVGEIPEQRVIFQDGEVATVVDAGNSGSDPAAESPAYLDSLPAALPYYLPRPQSDELRVAMLGGSALALALSHGASEVHVVEVNPQISEIVSEELADFSSRLYGDPRVHTYSVDARGFFARSSRFDLITLDVGGARGIGAAGSLRETYAYTLEAFELFLESLFEHGILALGGELSSPPRSSLKLLATAAEALRRLDLDPPRHVIAIRSWNRFLILVKPSEITRNEIATARAFCENRGFDLAYFPEMDESQANRFHILEEPEIFRGAQALLGPVWKRFLSSYKFRIAPATDDRPYFFHFFRWATLAELIKLRTRGGAALMDLGYILLLTALPQAAVAGLLVILLPLRIAYSSTLGAGRVGLYFLYLGLAFLFLEIAFIQRLTLFLAHPLSAAAVVLAGFLFFAGLGSGASRRLDRLRLPGTREPLHTVLGAIVVLALVYLLFLPAVLARGIAWPVPAKVALALFVIAPLAFLLGMPFPLGLRNVAKTREELVPWAWGVNGWASVLSAVLATLLAVHFGFSFVVAAACGLYLLAARVAPR
ncbi:MAG: SAM-dependent methyltransferase [bacterium]|nr:SAM-dependent methyltransferase [bacterium]